MKLSKLLVRRLESRARPAVCPECKGVGRSGIVIRDLGGGRDDQPQPCATCGRFGSYTQLIIHPPPGGGPGVASILLDP